MTLVVTGAGGMLGNAVVKAAKAVVPDTIAFTHPELDVRDAQAVGDAFRAITDPVVINCAGIVRGREDIPYVTRWFVNASAPGMLASQCARLVQVSTDCVFSGIPGTGPYDETSLEQPGDWYGMSKFAGEVSHGPHVTVRGSFIGFEGGLLAWLLSRPQGATVQGYTDHVGCGTDVADYADALVAIARNAKVTGIVHLVRPRTTKAILLRELGELFRPDIYMDAGPARDGPRHLDLRSKRTDVLRLPDWRTSLRRMAHDYIGVSGVAAEGIRMGTYDEEQS